jgi:hypothetical protein
MHFRVSEGLIDVDVSVVVSQSLGGHSCTCSRFVRGMIVEMLFN